MFIKEFHAASAYVITIREDHFRAEVVERRTGLTSWADFQDFDTAKKWAVEGAIDYEREFYNAP